MYRSHEGKARERRKPPSDLRCIQRDRTIEDIKTIMYNLQSQKYGPLGLHESKRRFYLMSQDKHMTVTIYLE
jgi:hypothetical protein